ncbi:MAG: hypothetical protein AAFY17_06670 [Cyanobacteria bacterium J06642_11]
MVLKAGEIRFLLESEAEVMRVMSIIGRIGSVGGEWVCFWFIRENNQGYGCFLEGVR